MEIKINNLDHSENKITKQKCLNEQEISTFNMMLEKDKKEISVNKNIKSEEELAAERADNINKIINSSAAKHIDEIAKTDICNGNEKYFEKDGTLNVRDIIVRFGNNISDKDLQKFQGEITGLWKQGLINDENYFEGMAWIEQKVLSRAINFIIKNKENNVLDRLTENSLNN